MSKGFSSASDVISFHNIETGGNSAGNGGAGSNTGAISTNANITFHASTDTGGNVQDVHHAGVHDHATSTTTYTIDSQPTQNVMAGIGGNGGSDNAAMGGSVSLDLTHTVTTTETASLSNVLNNSHDFHASDLVHV